jgi:hypothetical protein
MMTRLDEKLLAEELASRHVDVRSLSEYLGDVAYYMGPCHTPRPNCPQCGREILRNHNGARYCSNRCRQH